MAVATEDSDSRLEFIYSYIELSLKIKPDKWTKMLSVEDNKQLIMDFLDKADRHTLIFADSGSGQLTPLSDFPSILKAKAVYFIKHVKEAVPKENIHKALMYGDLSSSPLEQLQAVIDEVFAPILCNPQNHRRWPKVVADDIVQHVLDFQSTMFRITGQIKGKTLLPLPPGTEHLYMYDVEELSSSSLCEPKLRHLVHTIETMVIQWCHQVHGVLEHDSSQVLEDGQYLGPYSEIEFWDGRKENLQCIYAQLKEPKVVRMAKILEKVNSCYLPSFKNMFRDVVAALAEAQDITLHLAPLQKHFEYLEQADFPDLYPLLHPLIHTVCLVWNHSKYYSSPSKIIVLIQKICNLLIDMCTHYLDPSNIFKSELEESLEKVNTSFKVLNHFLRIYQDYRTNMSQYLTNVKVNAWAFPDRRIFERFNLFLARLTVIKEFFETSQEFFKLEKIEMGGVRGRMYGVQVTNIHQEFLELYGSFANKTYDALDPTSEEFVQDYSHFKEKIHDLDQRLGAVVCLSFEDCTSIEAIFKLLQMFGSLLERPVVKKDFTPYHSRIVQLLEAEIDMAKKIYDQQLEIMSLNGKANVHKNMPPIAGTVRWIRELRYRISSLITGFKQFENIIKQDEWTEYLLKKFNEMSNLLI
ncbi:dynein beta chain, ciliary-like, partial [Limulus polyphemus]|uniref:Dynein beta chain, ciliary-like n=1 Tax=Limulus polyphemus TaxID=6850 RepID=A0ABM1RUT7_LIMPO